MKNSNDINNIIMPEGYVLRPATLNDAKAIGSAIVMAVGEELSQEFAGEEHTLDDVRAMFASLACLDDAQYSYLNTFVAEDEATGDVAGVSIAYDGALLEPLRRRFFEAALLQLGRDMKQMPDETSDDEVYLDTLAVFPAHRRRGLAHALIEAQAQKARRMGKPLGLLVDKENDSARNLYESVGFRYEGERPFASEMMDHLVMQ